MSLRLLLVVPHVSWVGGGGSVRYSCLGRREDAYNPCPKWVELSSAGLHNEAPPPSKRATGWEAWVVTALTAHAKEKKKEQRPWACS